MATLHLVVNSACSISSTRTRLFGGCRLIGLVGWSVGRSVLLADWCADRLLYQTLQQEGVLLLLLLYSVALSMVLRLAGNFTSVDRT
jgi:hypothetical protein